VRSLAVICIPQQSPVKLSRWAFRLLLEPAAAEFADHHNARDDGLERRSDEFILRQAMALDGLNFDLLAEEDHGQAVRIAEVVARHAAALRLELRRRPSGDQRDEEFAEILGTLAMHLDGFWMTERAKPLYITKIVVRAAVRGHFPLWAPGPPEVSLDPAAVKGSSELVAEFLSWADDDEVLAAPQHSADPRTRLEEQHRAFLERGQVLARRLSEELGSHHRVTYQGDGCIPEREMLRVSFFALVLGPGNSRDRPAGLVRRIHTAPVPTDESMHRDLQWHPSEYLRRHWLGHNELDHVEISEEEAEAIIAHWHEHGVAWRPGD
jgi:hypothetical protein